MIFGVGLPRSAGQTLQAAISTVTGKPCYHSIGVNYGLLKPDEHSGAVECFAPVKWLDKKYRGCLFIFNTRNRHEWFKSCARVYEKSADWNHPLWKYPLNQFQAHYDDYYATIERHFTHPRFSDRVLVWDVVRNPEWCHLCDFLGVDEPSESFPNMDRVGRSVPTQDNAQPSPPVGGGFGFE